MREEKEQIFLHTKAKVHLRSVIFNEPIKFEVVGFLRKGSSWK